MKSQAYFEKIHKHIENNLDTSTTSIRIAVAWFTDPKLFNVLCKKAKNGIKVELIIANHEINHDCKITYRELINNGGTIYWIGNEGAYAPLMHNKFCIIDNRILITGSYNWTQKAKSNHESITIIEEDFNLILDFNQEFDKIKDKYYNPNAKVDWNKIVIRLETLLNVIKLEDLEDIKYQIEKTKNLIPKNNSDQKLTMLNSILDHCVEKEFSKAIVLIQNFTSEFKIIKIFDDPEIPAFKLEIRSLEYQITSLLNEKIDIEKNIKNFELKYNEQLGEIIIKILLFKKIAAEKIARESKTDSKKQYEYEEANFEYEEFSKANKEKLNAPKPFILNSEILIELKKNYRLASKLCHPDKVTEEQKEIASKLFTELKSAYDNNNIEKVNQILKDLEKGVFKSQGEIINEKDKLALILASLTEKRKELEAQLIEIKNTETFNTINKINNWEKYFEKEKKMFKKILVELQTKQINQNES